MINRRQFIKQSAITSIGFMALSRCTLGTGQKKAKAIKIISDPKGYLDLPEGFSYKIISKAGQKMSDGFLVPGRPDGMGTFLNETGKTVIIRNHENSPSPLENSPFGLQNELLPKIETSVLYDAGQGTQPGLGGTTTLIFDEKTQQVEKEFLSLAGTYRNCAGGITPWNSWLTCEEDVTRADGTTIEKDHGYVFEVPAVAKGPVAPIPITAMGRFNHEAVAVDPKTGIVYQTEDRPDGLLYRFIPNEKGNLQAGGQLQVLAVVDQNSLDTRNWKEQKVQLNTKMSVKWMDIDNIHAPEDDLRYRGFEAGAARFARGEGMWMGENELYFACTNGGPQEFGQVFRYTLSPKEGSAEEIKHPGILELFAESNDKSILHMCDNLTISPWGDIFLCEDNSEQNRIHVINKEGEISAFAINQSSDSEFAGIVFSPSGKTMFVNIQANGDTLAITGPWENYG